MKTAALVLAAALAFPTILPAAESVTRIPTPGGEVILPTARDTSAYNTAGYAAARRVGDTLYLSGVIAGRASGEGNDTEAFKSQVRRAFERIRATLKAS